MAIPYFNIPGDTEKPFVTQWTIRRDVPDYERNGTGEVKAKRKYSKPPGAKNQLYVPPMMPAGLLQSANSVFIITEGEIKTLVLARVATNNFSSEKWSFTPLGLSGVDNFKKTGKGETPHGERKISEQITDFQQLKFDGATVCICFDSD